MNRFRTLFLSYITCCAFRVSVNRRIFTFCVGGVARKNVTWHYPVSCVVNNGSALILYTFFISSPSPYSPCTQKYFWYMYQFMQYTCSAASNIFGTCNATILYCVYRNILGTDYTSQLKFMSLDPYSAYVNLQ